ncbi:MAG: dTDP-4-dehydrorhamnose 3,5-epimerase [Clostridium sp.]|nr:dTDP-4-dehydrorhamnose 3,5-epimerase [Clostridium sp.]
MKLESIDGPVVIEPRVFSDSRGYFFESWSERDFDRIVGREVRFVQDNESASSRGVIRGLHFQRPPHAQAKLVRCVSGRVLDIAVDIRRGSPTYGDHIAVELSGENHRSLFIPRGFAHGFAVLSDRAVFQYKCDNYYCPESEGGISIFDSSLGIDWLLPISESILSDKDRKHPLLKDFDSPFYEFIMHNS